MSCAANHMRRSHRSERYKPGRAGGRNFSRSKYHRISSARRGLLAGLFMAAASLLRRRKTPHKKRKEITNGDQDL